MRILLACQQSPHDYPIPAYRFWRKYFVEGLREAGHEIVEVANVDWARGLLPLSPDERSQWRDETWSRTVESIKTTGRPDLFLGYLYPQQIDVSAVRSFHNAGVPTVNFFCDNVREFRRLPVEFAPFDVHWVPEHEALPLYAKKGWRTVFAPMPCWVDPSRRQASVVESLPATFVGSSDAARRRLFSDALKRGAEFEIRGRGWQAGETPSSTADAKIPRAPIGTLLRRQWQFAASHGLMAAARKVAHQTFPVEPTETDFSGPVRPAPSDMMEYERITREARVCIGVNRFPSLRYSASRPGRYSRLRDIEAPMLGACYLTEWAPELPKLYDVGREIEVYRDAAELVEKLAELAGDGPRRCALRQAGQRRALAEHTVAHSVRRIAQALGLKSPAQRASTYH